MVLLRIRSAGPALFLHEPVPWILDANELVINSAAALMNDLDPEAAAAIANQREDPRYRDPKTRRISIDEFTASHEFLLRDQPLDMKSLGSHIAVVAGEEIIVRPKGSRDALASAAAARTPTRSGAEYSAVAMSRMAAGDTTSRTPLSARSGHDSYISVSSTPNLTNNKSEAARRALDRFLAKHELAHISMRLHTMGVATLAGLCGRTSDEIAELLDGDPVAAFHVITLAHHTMRDSGMVIDWKSRFETLYERYNPAKVPHVEGLLDAYAGDEEGLWWALREKYETRAAMVAQRVEGIRGSSLLENTGTEGDTSGANDTDTPDPRPKPTRKHVDRPQSARSSPARKAKSPRRVPLANVPSTTPSTISISCPSCRARLEVPQSAFSDAVDVQKARKIQEELDEEREKHRVLFTEQTATIERLNNQLRDMEALSNHYQNLCREQKEWLNILERRVELEADARGRAVQEAQSIASRSGQPPPLAMEPSPLTPKEPMSESGPPGLPLMLSTSAAAAHTMSEKELARRVRNKLVEFYVKHDPSRLKSVDIVLGEWRGKLGELERLIDIEPAVLRARQPPLDDSKAAAESNGSFVL